MEPTSKHYRKRWRKKVDTADVDRQAGSLLPNQRNVKTQNSKNLASTILNKCLVIDFRVSIC